MAIAIYPGSFEPVTLGHIDVIKRSAKLFDKVIVCVMYNIHKQGKISFNKRIDLIKKSLSDFENLENIKNVEIDSYSGLLVDYAKSKNANVIVKGLRHMADFEAELQYADVNRHIAPEIETVFLTSRPEYSCVSSTNIREMAYYGVDLTGFVHDNIKEEVMAIYRKKEQ